MTINTRSMRSSSNALFAIVLISTAMLGCSKKDTPIPDPCLGVSYDVQYFKTEAIGSSNNGTIAITFPIGDTISYQLNSGAYQASPGFTNLAPGNYVITVKNQNGCTDTAQITILNYGPKYAVNGSKNFDTDASIVSSWDRIKARAVDGNPSFMPAAPNSPLTNVDKQKITDWVNAGHRQSD